MKIYFFLQSPYTVMIGNQLDFLNFENEGYSIRILDGTRLLLPQLEGIHGMELLDPRVIKLQSSFELEDIARQMTSDDWVIFLGGYYEDQVHESSSPYGILSDSPARLGAVYASHTPMQTYGNKLRLILHMRYRPRTVPTLVTQKIRSLLGDGWSLKSVSRHDFHMRPLERLWVGTKTPALGKGLVDENTLIRPIHSMDAEALRRLGPPPSNCSDNLVLLDSMGPLHPDFHLNPSGYVVSTDLYFRYVSKSLMKISVKSGRKIVVAAHPRAVMGSLDNYYAPFTVEYFKTPELIRDSFAVLDFSASTSVGMAALLGKPIIFLFSNKLERGLNPKLQELLASELGSQRVSSDRIEQDFDIKEPSQKKYATYVRNYVTSKEWPPSGSFWSQVADDLAR